MTALLGAGRVSGALRARHPDAPWLWRSDWASGRIEDGNRGTMIAAWVFAGLWNLVSLPLAYFAVREALQEGNRAALLALLFPVVGVALLGWALRATLRYRRYGTGRLELAAVPIPLGHELRGTVVVPGALEVRDGLAVTLTCLRRVTRGSGKNRSTSETVLWQEERRVPAAQSRTAAGMATSIPVAFRIPANAEPADGTDPRDQVIWRLEVAAEVPGVDYHAGFEVPVFRTAAQSSVEAGETTAPLVTQPFVQSPTSRIGVGRTRRGTEIDFPPARNPGAAAGITAFLALWMLAVWATVHLDAPRFFQAIFAAFGLLLAWGAIASWFEVSRVSIGDGTVILRRGLFVPWRERRMAADEIAEVTTRIGMQAGGRPYYDLVLIRKDGRKVSAGRAIRDKREAEWLADIARQALRG